MQAIVTKFLSPTNTKPGRIKATASAGSVTLSWDHSINADRNHMAAARALVAKFGWLPDRGKGYQGVWHGGFTPNGDGCFVFAGDFGFELSFSTADQ